MEKLISVHINSVEGECCIVGTESIVRAVVINDVRQRVQNELDNAGALAAEWYDTAEDFQLARDIASGEFDLSSMPFEEISKLLETRLGWSTGPVGFPSHALKQLG